MALIYTNDLITDEEWESLLNIPLSTSLMKFLVWLRSTSNEGTPVGSLPDFFKSSYPEQLNGKFSTNKLPYRLADARNESWRKVLPYKKRVLKLYKVVQPVKKEVKPKGVPKCPPIFFNPNWNKPASSTSGKVSISFLGVKDTNRPWASIEMEIRAGISIGVGGKGFIHFLPTRQEMDKIISHLQEMRKLIPE